MSELRSNTDSVFGLLSRARGLIGAPRRSARRESLSKTMQMQSAMDLRGAAARPGAGAPLPDTRPLSRAERDEASRMDDLRSALYQDD